MQAHSQDTKQTGKRACFSPNDKVSKQINKNALKGIDQNEVSFQYFGGVDLMKIEGLSHATILTIMSEVGTDGLKKFETANNLLHGLGWHRTIKLAAAKY